MGASDDGGEAGRVDWAWDELVLACGLAVKHQWNSIPRTSPEIVRLSEFLRKQPKAMQDSDFRSVGSVRRKLENIRSMHPNYRLTLTADGNPRKPTKGGKTTQHVIDAFVKDPAKMSDLARALWASGSLSRLDVDTVADDVELAGLEIAKTDVTAIIEGRVVQRLVTVRERNRGLRTQKIAESQALRGCISCEVCGFDFEAVYGELGRGYAQVHHIVPLHFSSEVESTTADLILLCSNCHSMIHAGPRWKTPEELREIVRQNGLGHGN